MNELEERGNKTKCMDRLHGVKRAVGMEWLLKKRTEEIEGNRFVDEWMENIVLTAQACRTLQDDDTWLRNTGKMVSVGGNPKYSYRNLTHLHFFT
jgi:hypothetical protein